MVIVNGQLSENIILDSGFNFGKGVFETILVKDKPIFLKEHMQRMAEGIETLNINNRVDEKEILENVDKYKIQNCVLKVAVTDKNIVLSTRENPYKPSDYLRGFKLKISGVKRNPYSHVVYTKSLNYTDNIIEKETAAKEGYDEVLFTNVFGEIAEGAVSNFFFVKDEVIFTPATYCGILKGIIRDWVINKYNVVEGKFNISDIVKADEVFITNSLFGIMKVVSIGNIDFSESKISEDIRLDYEKYINNIY